MGRQHQGMDRPGVRQVPEGSGEQGKMENSGCKIICGAPTTLAVKRLMMMIIKFNLSGNLRTSQERSSFADSRCQKSLLHQSKEILLPSSDRPRQVLRSKARMGCALTLTRVTRSTATLSFPQSTPTFD